LTNYVHYEGGNLEINNVTAVGGPANLTITENGPGVVIVVDPAFAASFVVAGNSVTYTGPSRLSAS
jgi:hypothetical protein